MINYLIMLTHACVNVFSCALTLLTHSFVCVYLSCRCWPTTVWPSMLVMNVGLCAGATVKFHKVQLAVDVKCSFVSYYKFRSQKLQCCYLN